MILEFSVLSIISFWSFPNFVSHFFNHKKLGEGLVKWKACGQCETKWAQLNSMHCPNVVCVCEAQL